MNRKLGSIITQSFSGKSNPESPGMLVKLILSISLLIFLFYVISPAAIQASDDITVSENPEHILGAYTPPLKSVSWSPDGELIASPGPGGDILISSAETGSIKKVMTGHEESINNLTWTADGNILVSASTDNTVRSWDVETGENITVFTGHDDWVLSVDISPQENIAASGGWDSTIYLWDVTTGEEIAEIDSPGGWVRKIKWSPDGELFAAGTNNRSYIWNKENTELLYTLGDLRTRIRALAWLHDVQDGEKFVLGDDEGNIRLHQLEEAGETNILFEKDIDRQINSLEYSSAAGSKLAVTGKLNDILLLDPETGDTTKRLQGHGNYVNQASWTPDNNKLVSASQDGTIKIWNTATGEAEISLSGHQEVITSVSFSPEGKKLATGSEDRRIRVWSPPSAEVQQSFRGHTEPIRSISWSPDGSKLASGAEDNALIVWEIDTSPEPQFVAGEHRDRTLFDWDVFLPRGREEITHEDWIFHVEWSPTGDYIASASYDGTAGIWQAEDGEPWQRLNHEQGWVRQIIWVPDTQESVTIGEKGGIHHWDIAGDLEQQFNKDQPELRTAAFNPQGTLLALSNYENKTQILNFPDFSVLTELETHEGLTFDLTWSPDGQYLASAGEDMKITIWEIQEESGEITHKFSRNLPGFSNLPPRSIDWSADGNYLAAHDGHYLLLWRIDSTR